jgi:hypothetical protein
VKTLEARQPLNPHVRDHHVVQAKSAVPLVVFVGTVPFATGGELLPAPSDQVSVQGGESVERAEPADILLLDAEVPPRLPMVRGKPPTIRHRHRSGWTARTVQLDLARRGDLGIDQLCETFDQDGGPGRRVVADVAAVVDQAVCPADIVNPHTAGLAHRLPFCPDEWITSSPV